MHKVIKIIINLSPESLLVSASELLNTAKLSDNTSNFFAPFSNLYFTNKLKLCFTTKSREFYKFCLFILNPL